jgi:hypothetical protein
MGDKTNFEDIPQPFKVELNPVNLQGGLGVDMGLDDVNVHLDPIEVDVGLDPVEVDLGLDNIKADLELTGERDRPVTIGLAGDPEHPVTINPVTIDLGLDNIRADLGLDDINVCLSLAMTQIPNVRVHLPTKYKFGFSLFGVRIVDLSFSGETMLVTEDNPPRIFQGPVPHERREWSKGHGVYASKVTLTEDEVAG